MQETLNRPLPSQPDLAADAGRYWSDSSANARVQDMSHWRGRGRWSDEQLWQSWGKSNVARFQHLLKLACRDSIDSMLEWGPGGGCNAIHFSKFAGRMYGVDISAANLAECQAQLGAAGYADFVPIQFDAANPAAVLDRVDRAVDFFLCTAVFQHFPSQAYGRHVVEIAHQLLADEGIAMIQIRYDDGSETLRCKSEDYHRNVSTFTSYPIDGFWQIAAEAGFEPLAVSLLPSTKYAFYLLRKGTR